MLILVLSQTKAEVRFKSSQVNFNFNFEAEVALFSDNTATNPTTHRESSKILQLKTSNIQLKSSNTYQAQPQLNSTQSQPNLRLIPWQIDTFYFLFKIEEYLLIKIEE